MNTNILRHNIQKFCIDTAIAVMEMHDQSRGLFIFTPNGDITTIQAVCVDIHVWLLDMVEYAETFSKTQLHTFGKWLENEAIPVIALLNECSAIIESQHTQEVQMSLF